MKYGGYIKFVELEIEYKIIFLEKKLASDIMLIVYTSKYLVH